MDKENGVIFFGIVGLFISFSSTELFAQSNSTISGTVKDAETSEVLPGVNIKVKGTAIGTATDDQGQYELTVESLQDTLVVSFIGYQTKEVPIQGRTEATVALQPQAILGEEMVVTGYLTESRENLTGSISHVSSEALQQSSTNNLASMLQGQSAGVFVTQGSGQPGATPQVVVGGIGSISAGTQPLYVIDGIISSYDNVDPSDVKSLNVLKGPSATSIYGSRGSNGVIVISTKSGSSQDKTHININLAGGVGQALKGNLHYMNSEQYIDYYEQMGAKLPVSPDMMGHTDWWNELFQPAAHQKYHASVSGGTKQDQYYISGNFFRNDGTLISEDYTRYSGRINYKRIFSDQFTINTRISGRFEKKAHDAGKALFLANIGLPWDKAYNEDGSPRKPTNFFTRQTYNPLYTNKYNYNRNQINKFNITEQLSYDFTNYLTFTSNNFSSFSNGFTEVYTDPKTSYGASTDGSLQQRNNYTNDIETSNLLKYKQSLDHNNINTVLGFEYNKSHGRVFSAEGAGITDFDVLSVAASPYKVDGSKYEYVFVSQFLQLQYNYNNKYYFTGSVRRDGSSRFGSKKQYSNFYALGGAWEMSDEPFFNADFINQLKVRFGYGITGNANIGNYGAKSLQSYVIKYNRNTGSYPAILGNPFLTWEKQHELQVGLDLKLFNSRLDMTINGYQKKSKDLLQAVALPYQSGFISQLQNVGAVRNRGLEANIKTVNIPLPDLQWTTSLNITYNKNKVVNLYENEQILTTSGAAYSPNDQITTVGDPINTWYLPKWAGVNPKNGDPQWQKIIEGPNGEKQIKLTNNYDSATRQKAGNSIPEWYGGIINEFKYKGFSLNVLFRYVGGYKIYSSILSQGNTDGKYNRSNQLNVGAYSRLSRWKSPGDHATEPKVVLGGNKNSSQSSTRYLMNGNHLRLKNLKLSYQLPSNLLKQLEVGTAKVYFEGSNIWTLTAPSYIGPDPEVSLSGAEDYASRYPNSRTYMFGIDFKF